MSCEFTKKWMDLFRDKHNFIFQPLVPRCNFLHAGKQVHVGDMAWIYGNIPGAQNQIVYADTSNMIVKGEPQFASSVEEVVGIDIEDVEEDNYDEGDYYLTGNKWIKFSDLYEETCENEESRLEKEWVEIEN